MSDLYWLEQALAIAEPAQRPVNALALGLALADRADEFDDGSAELAEPADRALALLTEAGESVALSPAGRARAQLTSGILRWRRSCQPPGTDRGEAADLDRVIRELTRALAAPTGSAELSALAAAARWCLICARLARHASSRAAATVSAATEATDQAGIADLRAAMALAAQADQAGQTESRPPPGVRWRYRTPALQALCDVQFPNPSEVEPAPASSPSPVMSPSGSPLGAGLFDRFALGQFRESTDRVQKLLDDLSPEAAGGDQGLRLRVMASVQQAAQAMAAGVWTPEQDQQLQDLQGLAEAGAALDPQIRLMIRIQSVLLRAARLAAGVRATGPKPAAGELEATIAELEAVSTELTRTGGSLAPMAPTLRMLAGPLLMLRMTDEQQPADLDREQLIRQVREHLADAPPELAREIDAMEAAIRMMKVVHDPDPADYQADPDTDYSTLRDYNPDWYDVGGADLPRVRNLVHRAQFTRDPADIETALQGLRGVNQAIGSGHQLQPQVLSMLAYLLALRSSLTASGEDATDAIDAALAACELMTTVNREALQALTMALFLIAGMDLRAGPFLDSERVLERVLAEGGPADPTERFLATAGLGTARVLQWRGGSDPLLLARARQALDQAEQLIPATGSTESIQFTFGLLQVNSFNATLWGEPAGAAAAIRIIDRLEPQLRADPVLATRLSGMTMPGVAMPGASNPAGPGASGILGALAQMRQMLGLMQSMGPLLTGGPQGGTANALLDNARRQARAAQAAGAPPGSAPPGMPSGPELAQMMKMLGALTNPAEGGVDLAQMMAMLNRLTGNGSSDLEQGR